MSNLYTLANCPMCGQMFNKHITAIYCSKRCSNRAAARRRSQRFAGPLTASPHAPPPPEQLPSDVALDHIYLDNQANHLHVEFVGQGKDGGGHLRTEIYTKAQIGTWKPRYPIKLEPITEYETNATGEAVEVQKFALAHEEAFKLVEPITASPRRLMEDLGFH